MPTQIKHTKQIAYLHNHSVYSVKDGLGKPHEYSDKIKQFAEDGVEVVGFSLTEHGNLHSIVKGNEAFANSSCKYINGCELYHCEDVRTSLNNNKNRFHLIILAKTDEGLVNLYKICSHAGLNKTKTSYKEYYRTDEIYLKTHGKGLIALSGCVGGLIPTLILNGKYEEAKNKALEFKSIFDDFYLEIQPHDFSNQLLVNSDLCKISAETGIPLVITTDTHYVEVDDIKYHELLFDMSIKSKDPTQVYHNILCHLRTYDELYDYCIKYDIPISAIENTVVIAKSCVADAKPKNSRGLLPSFKCPGNHTEESYLKLICYKNFYKKAMDKKFKDFDVRMKRLNEELDVICSLGFSGYFLILWDWFEQCKKRGILLGKGRGSAAGSIISYLLDITSVDPIVNNFLFSRFLNFERIEYPDVDSDVAKDKRAEAIQILLETYGQEHVAQIVSFTKYNIKNTNRAIASMIGDKNLLDEVTIINNLLPNSIDNKQISFDLLEDIYSNPDNYEDLKESTLNKVNKFYSAIQELYKKYPQFYHAVSKLNGCVVNCGLHAGGVVISNAPLYSNVPIMKGNDTAVLPVVQLEMSDLDFYKALKIDVLGLNTLTQIKTCMDIVGLDHDWFDSEDYSDPAVYEMLRRGDTANVFQFSSCSATRMLVQMKPNCFEDLVTHNAGNRPGPQEVNPKTGKSMWDLYIERRKSGVIPSLHPSIDDVLKPTLGCIWFQEQCQMIGQIMAGYSLGQSDLRIRKVLAKKKLKEIPVVKNEFIYGRKSLFNDKHEVIGVSNEPCGLCKGAINNGYTEEFATEIFESMEGFASYCFRF